MAYYYISRHGGRNTTSGLTRESVHLPEAAPAGAAVLWADKRSSTREAFASGYSYLASLPPPPPSLSLSQLNPPKAKTNLDLSANRG